MRSAAGKGILLVRRLLSLIIICALVVGALPFSVVVAAPPMKGAHKIVVQNTDAAARKSVEQGGGTLLADYGAFSLYAVPGTSAQAQALTAARDTVHVRDDLNLIQLRGGAIDTTSGAAPVAANVRQAKAGGKQLWFVQFVGPVKTTWLDNLRKLGVEIVAYVPSNAYVVWLDGGQLTQLESLAKSDPTIQWTGEYHPQYRLAPNLRDSKAPQGAKPVAVTVQFYRTGAVQTSVDAVKALGGAVLRPAHNVLGFVNLSLEVPASQLPAIAARADVFNVEPYVAPKKNDERQGQILADNVTGSNPVVPSGAGYLSFLSANGFPTTPASYPVVAVVDDGVDNGTTNPLHPDFHDGGVLANPSRVVASTNCTTGPDAAGNDGHGNLNAGIVAGFNSGVGAAYEDTSGYNYGLGISPYGRVGNIKIFRDGGAFDEVACGNTDTGTVAAAYAMGAAITSNSWGSDVNGSYDSESQAYDALTRDASAATAGNQPMLHVFAAGNAGPGTSTIGSPGTAKNVLAVGATENVRDQGVADGCGETNADNADDIASFSSRGPTSDGRAKPDISAPGTHISGLASQSPGYNGTGVCAAPGSSYYPAGQTLYTWSTGTSHSTPAIAGVASLVYNYYGRVLKPGQTPSPAMAKALILNNPRYLTGTDANDTLPSNTQGWGDANLKELFDGTTHRYLVDQATTFTTTGETFVKGGTVTSGSKPFKVTLVWTDAPGATTGAAYVNDLNLEVTVGGQVYKGNVFSGAFSTTGGTADAKNNIESVFLPAGTTGPFAVKVTAANIAGVAIPGGPGAANQDFALVVSNGDVTPSAALGLGGIAINDSGPNANNNGVVEPGEAIAVTIGLTNGGDAGATGVSGTLSSPTAGVTVTTPTASYGTLGASGSGNGAFAFTLAPGFTCGQALQFSETVTYSGGQTTTISFTIPTGTLTLGSPATYNATDLPQTISPVGTSTITSNIPVGATGVVAKIRVTVNITHSYDQDLVIRLFAPGGTSYDTLSYQNGGSGDNYGDMTHNVVFDDDAATSITSGTPPYINGPYRPEQALSVLNGLAVNGTWQVQVRDTADQDGGSFNSASLEITPRVPSCQPAVPPTLTSIAITAPSGGLRNVKVGGTLALTASGTYSDNTSQPLTGGAWQAMDPAIAVVDANGTVTGQSPGTAVITYTKDGIVGQVSVVVSAPTAVGIQPAPAPASRSGAGAVGQPGPTPAPAPPPRP